MYEEFKHPNNNALYAFIAAPAALLATTVPPGAKWGTVETAPAQYDGEGNETVPAATRQKTIEEFVIKADRSVDGTKAIVLLAAMECPTMRTYGVNEQDLAEWDAFLTPYGLNYESGSWLTLGQYKEKLHSPEYRNHGASEWGLAE